MEEMLIFEYLSSGEAVSQGKVRFQLDQGEERNIRGAVRILGILLTISPEFQMTQWKGFGS